MSVAFFGAAELANLLARLPAPARPLGAHLLSDFSRANASAFAAQYRCDAIPATAEEILALAQGRIGDAALARVTASLALYNTITNGGTAHLSPTSAAYAFLQALRVRLEAESADAAPDETEDERLRRELGRFAVLAFDVQNEATLSGVLASFAEAMRAIWAEARFHEEGSDWVNRHPIAIAFASKVLSLTRAGDAGVLDSAFDYCAAAAAALGEERSPETVTELETSTP
jgi:hypothetical protein